jgi:hypothetical protein
MKFSAVLLSQTQDGSFVYSVIIGSMNVLVFYKESGRIFGFFEDGTKFSSSDKNIRNEKWFQKIAVLLN